MISRTAALKKASSAAQVSRTGTCSRSKSKSTVSSPVSPRPLVPAGKHGVKGAASGRAGPRCLFTSAADAKKQKRDKDRDFLISVLESSATKRDAKAYLQTFGPAASQSPPKSEGPGALPATILAVEDMPQFVQGKLKPAPVASDDAPHVAVIKFRQPQLWDDSILSGVVKTLTQLSGLGFLSVIVVDCDSECSATSASNWRKTAMAQADRVAAMIRKFGTPPAKVVDSALCRTSKSSQSHSPIATADLIVGFEEALTTPLQSGHLVVVPAVAYSEETTMMEKADPNKVVLALTRFLSGLQFRPTTNDHANSSYESRPSRKALVDRIIVIDPLGGIPAKSTGHGAQVFVNLEDQFETIRERLALQRHDNPETPPQFGTDDLEGARLNHLANLHLTKDTLSILPPTSSAVITSPAEAANLRHDAGDGGFPTLTGPVGTRRTQNPLIHNLLTDRPIYSSSLPIGRIKPSSSEQQLSPLQMPTTTLAKRGLPVTIFPDTRVQSWSPPKPGEPRLRLTDTCVDLGRLVHLINDSFNRELDVEHYLRRVDDSLAGIIIAGEYEGGAILTWERPFGLDKEMAYRTGRLVPYLDKFAVLKKSQGAGGVADIVFNAMVRDCFPYGVCWRSRKDNPVNKWYFERSRGTRRLDDSNWVMFWTTPDASLDEQKMKDYEDVCRNVVPSWADMSKVAD
ncbi:mitochondrial amino-acid acetyltransferase [Thozetella sp. PMI_491]|nr:mitochondrial amino-acid acetyltransferase [Thozetella sp. PMI_491]